MDKTPEPSHHSSPRPFAVYYGWPSALGNRERLLTEFDAVILGAGLERPDHPDHAAARKLVTELKAHATDAYGYLDLAAIATEPVTATLKASVERLAVMEVTGLLLDNTGREHGVELADRKMAVNNAHEVDLAVILNAGDPSEALVGLPLRGGDGYLIEGFMLADGHDASGPTLAAKCQEARNVRERTDISIFGIATLEPGSGEDSSGIGNAGVVELWQAAKHEQLDYFLITDPLYGARGPHKDMVAALPR